MVHEYCFACMQEIAAYPCPHCGNNGFSERAAYALLPGTILKGRYLVGNVLGQGGFGITYIGLDLQLRRKLAIKEYYPSSYVYRQDATGTLCWYSGREAQEARISGQEMFLKEARKMSLVSHIPEVVQVFDVFQENETAYICMDYVDGVTLKKELASGSLFCWEDARRFFLPVIEAMGQVHKAGLVHRDLSPDNIMRKSDGSIRILDLGAAKDLNVNSGQSSVQVAKSGFSPPEQYMLRGNSGSWTDVYAMAATMYYALTGKLPLPAMDRMNPEGDGLDWSLPQLQALPKPVLKALKHAMALRIADRTQTMEAFAGELTAEPETKRKTMPKKVLMGAAAAAAALLLLITLGFRGKDSETPGKQDAPAVQVDDEAQPIFAKVTEDGKAYIPMPDGTTIEIAKKVSQAVITADRKHILAVSNGSLYETDINQTELRLITGNCERITDVRNDGVIYYDPAGATFRVPFTDYILAYLGKNVDYVVAEHTISVLYRTDIGGIYTLKGTDKEGKQVGTYEGGYYLKGISDDGNQAVWSYEKDDTEYLMLSDADEIVTLKTGQYLGPACAFTKDGNLTVIAEADKLWFKTPGKDPREVPLGRNLVFGYLYTDQGKLSQALTRDVESVYIDLEGDKDRDVYNVSLDGTCKRVLSDVQDFDIRNGRIIYRDREMNLYEAKLRNGSLSEERRIAEGVNVFELAGDGTYVYYMTDCGDDLGDLYCYKVGESMSQKVSSDVMCDAFDNYAAMYCEFTGDGSCVFFYKNAEYVRGISDRKADLFLLNYGEQGAQLVAESVVVSSVTSMCNSGVDKNGFWFMKYDHLYEEAWEIHGDLMYHNGKEAKLVAADVLY